MGTPSGSMQQTLAQWFVTKAPPPKYKEKIPTGTPEEWAASNIGGISSAQRYYQKDYPDWNLFSPPAGKTAEDVRDMYKQRENIYALYTVERNGKPLGMVDDWRSSRKFEVRTNAPGQEIYVTKKGIYLAGTTALRNFAVDDAQSFFGAVMKNKEGNPLTFIPWPEGRGEVTLNITDTHAEGARLRIVDLPDNVTSLGVNVKRGGPVVATVHPDVEKRVALGQGILRTKPEPQVLPAPAAAVRGGAAR